MHQFNIAGCIFLKATKDRSEELRIVKAMNTRGEQFDYKKGVGGGGRRSANLLAVDCSIEGAMEIARRSRGTPRIANRWLRRVRDFAEVRKSGKVDTEVADEALNMLKVDTNGFDTMDRRILMALIQKFDGGPVGVDSIAAAIGEERDAIEEVYEPFLIHKGFIMRTPRGRVATNTAYQHFGLEVEARPGDLFDSSD